MTYYHGGVPRLRPGDAIRPGHSRDLNHPGCSICAARARGDRSGIDSASHRPDRIYVTTDREYARYHASLYGGGDVYVVDPCGDVEASSEDKFPSFTCASAVVVARIERAVTLSMSQRRDFFVRWAALDGIGRRDALAEFKRMVKDARRGRPIEGTNR